jgi:hypothetical protein
MVIMHHEALGGFHYFDGDNGKPTNAVTRGGSLLDLVGLPTCHVKFSFFELETF